MSPIEIDYYSDVLCVWAWIAQARLDELEKQWGERITVRHHFVDIFGDCEQKIPQSWGEKNGYEKFGEHVRHSAAPFDEAAINPDIWTICRPRSSAQAHLFLRAVAIAVDANCMATMAQRIRQAFFTEAHDISDINFLLKSANSEGLDTNAIERSLNNGSAIAALTSDLRKAADSGVRGSPTWILNEGRQVIYGNVGYRILSANIEELLNRPADEASWC